MREKLFKGCGPCSSELPSTHEATHWTPWASSSSCHFFFLERIQSVGWQVLHINFLPHKIMYLKTQGVGAGEIASRGPHGRSQPPVTLVPWDSTHPHFHKQCKRTHKHTQSTKTKMHAKKPIHIKYKLNKSCFLFFFLEKMLI